jgi:hypothetical protein
MTDLHGRAFARKVARISKFMLQYRDFGPGFLPGYHQGLLERMVANSEVLNVG